jgi:hypothetical protein
MMAERGLRVSHTTNLLRWMIHYVPEFEKRWNRWARGVRRSILRRCPPPASVSSTGNPSWKKSGAGFSHGITAINRKGVDSTSLEEIAAGIRTTKRALYCHVGDKEALLAACYRRSYEIFLHLLKRPKESDTSCLYRLTAYHEAASIVQVRDDIQPLRPTVGYESSTQRADRRLTSCQLD